MQRKIAFPSMAPAENDFGPYRLLSRIGRGGMGVTWKAVRKDAGADARPVVIKRILPDLAEEPALIEAFVNEAHVTATLSHPNIAQVLDFGRVEGEYYFAIEFVHGRTLQALLAAAAKKGLPTLPVPIACLLTQGALAALHYAHTRAGADGRPLRIVHRDISPDNLLIGFDGVLRVIDFGVAKARLRGRRDTQHGLVKGKWHYLSPEQAASEQLDGRSDLFAVGVTLYRMLCGRLPFEGNQWVAVNQLVKGKHLSPAALNPELPDVLVGVVERALEVNREKRFQSAELMSTALGTVLREVGPGSGQATLRAFVHWAFAGELEAEGVAEMVTPHQRTEFERWVRRASSQSLPAVPLGAAEPEATSAATRAVAAQRPSRTRLYAAAGVLFVLGAALVGVLALKAPSAQKQKVEFERLRASASLEADLAVLARLDAEAAAHFTSGAALLRTELDAQDAVPTADFVARAEAMRGEILAELQRVRAAQAPRPPEPVDAGAPAPAPIDAGRAPLVPAGPIDTVTFDLRKPKVRLINPRHNLNAALERLPNVSPVRVGRGETMSLVGPLFHFPRPWVQRADGVGRIPDDGAVKGVHLRFSVTGPASVLMLDFRPFDERTDFEPLGLGQPRPFALTRAHGNFLVVEGLDRFRDVEVVLPKKGLRDGLSVVVNCNGESVRASGVVATGTNQSCAFALVGPDTPRVVEFELTGRPRAFRNPKLPPFDSSFEWNPLEPRTPQLDARRAGNVNRLFGGARIALKGGDYKAATQTLEACVKDHPGSAECHLLWGYACSNLGEKPCAAAHYGRFLELAPSHAFAAEVRSVMAE